ncbi:MAG TPA: hypothetical protein VG013_04675 [Gemmataceae bacterium]|jgi:hypothetical protein|nr:hypothetical protein [Gemmataceae bacterium]
MTPAEAMHMIEGHRFAALTNLASNLNTFLRIAAQQLEVEALSRAMANDPAVISAVFHRATALSAIPGDGEREPEGDAAVATYLWLLSNHRPELAKAAAGSMRAPGHFFWARKCADDLHAAPGRANGNRSGPDGETTREATEDIEAFHRKP